MKKHSITFPPPSRVAEPTRLSPDGVQLYTTRGWHNRNEVREYCLEVLNREATDLDFRLCGV